MNGQEPTNEPVKGRFGRVALAGAALLALAVLTSNLWVPPLVVGTPATTADRWRQALSPEAGALVDRALEGVSSVHDHHAHLIATGHEGSGASFHPDLVSWLHPIKRIKTAVYQMAGGVEVLEKTDSQYVDRLQALVKSYPVDYSLSLLAFEAYHDGEGQARPDLTAFHVPNAWTVKVADRLGDRWEPVASIHPYRPDAVEALRRWHGAGVRMIKWLPNSMGIDPGDPRCDPFYDELAKLGVALLSHAGDEHAVDGETQQHLGNPLRLRRALDRGVTVIVAHCGGLGMGADLDTPGAPEVANFDLFLRLMSEPAYEGLLFGEISAVVLSNRHGAPLRTLLERKDLHSRIAYGSDYPLPAVDVLIQTDALAELGYLTSAEAELLDELFTVHPLLFDLVLKRTLRAPGTDEGFPLALFSRKIRARSR